MLDKANKGHHDFVFPPEVKARSFKRGVSERTKHLTKKKLALKKVKIYSFLTFTLINSLVRMLQCTESLFSIFFVHENIKKNSPSKVRYLRKIEEYF